METKIYKRNIVFRVRKISNRDILFGDNQCYELNEIALIVWNSLNGENTIDSIVNEIAIEYNADIEVIKEDVMNFINEMNKKNVILESE